MLSVDITRQARDFLDHLDAKQFRQIVRKIFCLMEDPRSSDVKPLQGHPFWRADMGEYRIIFCVEQDTLRIVLVDKRNDDEVYRKLGRMQRG